MPFPSPGEDATAASKWLAHRQFTIEEIFERQPLRQNSTLSLLSPHERLLLWSFDDAFNLSGDSSFYTDTSGTREVLRISARRVGNTVECGGFHVFDVPLARKIGVLKRTNAELLFVREAWVLLDAQEREVGHMNRQAFGQMHGRTQGDEAPHTSGLMSLTAPLGDLLQGIGVTLLAQTYTIAATRAVPVASFVSPLNPDDILTQIAFAEPVPTAPDAPALPDVRLVLVLALQRAVLHSHTRRTEKHW